MQSMKPQSASELDAICSQLNPKDLYELSQVYFDSQQLGLLLESETASGKWLWVDFRPLTFGFFILDEPLGFKKTKPKPLLTFIKTHGLGRQLTRLERDTQAGRVIHIGLETLSIEVRMIKTQKNIIATLEDSRKKPVSLYKISELPKNIQPNETQANTAERSPEAMVSEWTAAQVIKGFAKHAPKNAEISEADRASQNLQKKIERVEQTLSELSKAAENQDWETWRKAGEWLKANPQSKTIPLEFIAMISPKRSTAKNIEQIFAQAKKLKANQVAIRERLSEVQAELTKLKSVTDPLQWQTELMSRPRAKKEAAKVPQRQSRLSSGHPIAIGKSAENNLQLLRLANPWDLWIHLKDFPSAHAIVTKNKGELLKDAILIEAANKLIESSMSKRLELIKGEKFVIVAAEKRFVKPIKGSLGTVEYQNEKTFAIVY